MKSAYVHAVLGMLQSGVAVETVLTGLQHTLTRKNHLKLYAPVLLEVTRILEADKHAGAAVVTTVSAAHAKELAQQITEALQSLGADKTVSVKETIDETLIGGFVATFDYKECDQSYKKALTSLYESITK